MSQEGLDQALLKAHAAGDKPALAKLYAKAANATEDQLARGFYLTHAYVYALECGLPDAAELHLALCKAGREE